MAFPAFGLIGEILTVLLDVATDDAPTADVDPVDVPGVLDVLEGLDEMGLDAFQDLFDTITDPNDRALYEGFVRAVRCSSLSGKFSDEEIRYGMQAILQVGKKPVTDDRDPQGALMMQGLIMSDADPVRNLMTIPVVKMYWDMLTHKPGPPRYREADGGMNNPSFPDEGRAGMPYARTVPEPTVVPTDRPTPDAIFDALIGRGENEFEPHPAGFSTFFFAHAALITHDIFNTNHHDIEINNASSYLDLAPLYGNNQAEQNLIRTFHNGEVKRDSFLDKRILGLPPAVSVMVIMYSRFHNHAAKTLAAINEDGRFSLPANADHEAVLKRDNDLFQVARLVTNGLYVNISTNDYLRAIYNVNQTTSTWGLSPREPTPYIPSGVGNTVSREFNLLYRFHSVLSKKDAAWVTESVTKLFPEGTDVPNMAVEDFMKGLVGWMMQIPDEPLRRTVPGLVRNADGSYNDADLIAILRSAIDDHASSFGANHVPRVFRPLEKAAIMQARQWNVPSLNEFRAFCNLTRLETFEAINKDKAIAAKLAKLYKTPDDVELYAGLNAEENKPMMSPAMGICAPYTVMSVILGDAVTMIRGDRYMTTDYKRDILTNWGFDEVDTDKDILGGSKIYHLILAAFPDSVAFNSTYAMQPFYTSAASATIFDKLQTTHLYDFAVPAHTRPPVVLSSHATVAHVLSDQKLYTVPESVYLPEYTPQDPKQWDLITTSLAGAGGVQLVSNFAQQFMFTLLEKRRTRVWGTKQSFQLDIVNIGNTVALQVASVMSYLPLKSDSIPGGTYEEKDLSALFTNLLEYSADTTEPTRKWGLRGKLAAGMPVLTAAVTERVKSLTAVPAGPVGEQSESTVHTFGANFTKALLSQGAPVHVTADILVGNGYSVLGAVGLVFAQVVEFYLRKENETHWAEIVKLSATDRAAAGREADDAKLTRYILEGARLTSTATWVRTVVPADGQPIKLVIDQKGTKATLHAGDRVISSPKSNLDPAAFPKPTKVDLTRPLERYHTFGSAPRDRLGNVIGLVCLLKMVRTVATLPKLRPAPGVTGQLKLVTRPGGVKQYMTPDLSTFTSFPTTMVLYFDEA